MFHVLSIKTWCLKHRKKSLKKIVKTEVRGSQQNEEEKKKKMGEQIGEEEDLEKEGRQQEKRGRKPFEWEM